MFYLWKDGERHRNIFSVFYECQRGTCGKSCWYTYWGDYSEKKNKPFFFLRILHGDLHKYLV